MAFAALVKTDLQTTYQSYTDAIVQYTTATFTGTFSARSHDRTAQDLQTIKNIEQLESEIVSLKSQIKKTNAFSEKTKLNVDLQRKKAEIKELQQDLKL